MYKKDITFQELSTQILHGIIQETLTNISEIIAKNSLSRIEKHRMPIGEFINLSPKIDEKMYLENASKTLSTQTAIIKASIQINVENMVYETIHDYVKHLKENPESQISIYQFIQKHITNKETTCQPEA